LIRYLPVNEPGGRESAQGRARWGGKRLQMVRRKGRVGSAACWAKRTAVMRNRTREIGPHKNREGGNVEEKLEKDRRASQTGRRLRGTPDAEGGHDLNALLLLRKGERNARYTATGLTPKGKGKDTKRGGLQIHEAALASDCSSRARPERIKR